MRIAVLTSGILPIPAVKGGAVENLIDFYLEYNEKHRLHNITVYSVSDPLTKNHPALNSDINHYHYIEIWSIWSKIRKHIHKFIHGEDYYHYTIEYYLYQALKDIRKKNYDIVVIENRPGYTLKVADFTKGKIVIHLHNDFLNKDTKNATNIYSNAWRIITVSDFISNQVKTIENNDNKCITVNNGISLHDFSTTHSKPQSRSSLGLTNEDFVIVYSGRINKDKGIAELVEAITLLKSYNNIKLLVIGGSFFGDNNNDNPYITSLKKMAQQLGDRIVFTGFVPYSMVPGYLKIADIAVIPSQWEEPFGLTCLEAMAMGLPIIATKRGGIPEILKDHFAIVLQTGSDFVKNLSESIVELYKNPAKRKEMGQASFLESQKYDKEKYAEEFFKALTY